ncbi:MAG TPA: PHB depolymerase family esterase [Steroidobacteraceae bacterium]|nr:PHB depolymerase family esterase [Steroidobacteraceae bacterium]
MRRLLNRLGWSPRSWIRARKFHRVGWIAGRFRTPEAALRPRSAEHERRYYVYVPAELKSEDRVPLMIMLHGCKQNAEVFAEGTRMNRLADEHRFIVLYPEQCSRANPLRCWRWYERDTLHGQGDAALIAGIIRRVINNYPVDRARVYIAGISAGGAMASVVAFCYGEMLSACAIISGVMYGAAESGVDALAAMRGRTRKEPHVVVVEAARRAERSPEFLPALIIHGERDSTVHPSNADHLVQQFRSLAAHDSRAGPLLEVRERRILDQDRAYRQWDYLGNGQALVRKIVVEGLGHAWSGGDERHQFNDAAGPDASRLIWEFVSQFRRPERRDGTGAVAVG